MLELMMILILLELFLYFMAVLKLMIVLIRSNFFLAHLAQRAM